MFIYLYLQINTGYRESLILNKEQEIKKIINGKMVEHQCKGCGACCFCEEIRIADNEVEFIKKHPELIDLNKNDDGKNYLKKTPAGHCIALDPINKTCTIHNIRPIICQNFLSDFEQCQYFINKYYSS